MECLITQLRGVAKDDSNVMPFLSTGLLYFDNTIEPTQETNANRYYIPGGKIVQLGNEVVYEFLQSNGRITVSTSTPANKKARFSYDLLGATQFYQNNLSPQNFELRMSDLARCVNVTNFSPTSTYLLDDDYDISKLGRLTKMTLLNVAGSLSRLWGGDVVELADGMLANGRSNSVLVISHKAGNPSNIRVNGQDYDRYIHVVFGEDGYSIYAPIASSSALVDYSGYTPVYVSQ